MKQLLCSIIITLSVAATAYGSTYTAQTIKIASSEISDTAIEITNSKVITDNFSFKVPEGWAGNCVAVHNGSSLELYNKSDYDADGSGLLFTIVPFEDSSYQDLTNYCVLGFCGNTTYVLKEDYHDTYTDTSSSEYQGCKEAVKALTKNFVSFITD